MKIKYAISTRHFGQHDLGVTVGMEEIALAFSRQLDRIRLFGESQDSLTIFLFFPLTLAVEEFSLFSLNLKVMCYIAFMCKRPVHQHTWLRGAGDSEFDLSLRLRKGCAS